MRRWLLVVWMHFLKPEIEMFINRYSNDDDEREEEKKKRLYLNWRLFHVLKLQFFSFIVAPPQYLDVFCGVGSKQS